MASKESKLPDLSELDKILTQLMENKGEESGELNMFKEKWSDFFVTKKASELEDKAEGGVKKKKRAYKTSKSSQVDSLTNSDISSSESSRVGSHIDQKLRSDRKKKLMKKKSLTVKEESTSEVESDGTRQERSARYRNRNSHTSLVRALENLDNRKMPEFHKYDEASGEDLVRYMKKFETYCEQNYRGDKSLWVRELEKNLFGKSKEALRSLVEVDDSFEIAVKKMKEWYRSSDDLRRRANRRKFRNMQYIPGESLTFFCTRLEKAYKVAYGKDKEDRNDVMIEKFMDCAPGHVQDKVENHIISVKMGKKKVKWSSLKEMCRHLDGMRERKDHNEQEKECTINLSQPAKKPMFTNSTNENRVNTFNVRSRQFSLDRNISSLQPMEHHYKDSSKDLLGGGRGYVEQPFCSYCQRVGHVFQNCKFRLGLCFKCGERGHFIRDCNNRQRSKSQDFRAQSQAGNQDFRFNSKVGRGSSIGRNPYMNHNDSQVGSDIFNKHQIGTTSNSNLN